eukprot:gnl/Dysnectes_brevis/1238_a1382_3127.p1 GENE.gnl/Dysnectes_brevis/1238_a1382_3127~~gnl/Dysnectes_brevis/1238_a1382_3127.p1  ORF type:complete len:384 (+),score=121.56 gnl/Dysnectes_brevis/1238_a1382_3127:101-1252(+)
MLSNIKKTVFHDLHTKLMGDIVPFCGYLLPIKYGKETISEAHAHCRESASLFDVSHMTQFRFTGRNRHEFIESITVADLAELNNHQMRLSSFTTPEGGIIDDLMVTKHEDHIFLVANAGRADVDLAHLESSLEEAKANGLDINMEILAGPRSLLALQGPKVAQAISPLLDYPFEKQPFMSQREGTLGGIPVLVSRSGYTGLDGVEISVPTDRAVELAELLLDQPGVKACGLGARDSLRLEAGLCLYGSDIDTTTTPIEGGLAWTISKRRRKEGGFPGAERIQRQLASGVTRRRVGFLVKGAPARAHSPVYDMEGRLVGEVTSGMYSPTLRRPIAMGYVNCPNHKRGTQLQVGVRGRMQKAEVVRMPFVKPEVGGFYRGGEWGW